MRGILDAVVNKVASDILRGPPPPSPFKEDRAALKESKRKNSELEKILRKRSRSGHSYSKELGKKRLVPSLDVSVQAVIDRYPTAVGGMVEGAEDHRSYWVSGKLVAHTWPGKRGVWLRLR